MAQRPRAARKHAASSRVHDACLPRPKAAPGSRRIGNALLLMAALLLTPLFAHADIIHVDANAAGANNGSSWIHAYTDLQDALAASVTGDEIWVAAGLYKPVSPVNTGSVTEAERLATFQLKNGVEIYGGFAGTENQRDQRNPYTHLAVLSGDIDANDTTNANGVVVDADDIVGDNSFNVVTGGGTDATAILDGFVITAGQANGDLDIPCSRRCGGGIIIVNGSPSLASLVVSGNHGSSGGGMYNHSSSPTLTHVSFSGNRGGNGGGMHNHSSSPTLTHVSFSGNSASTNGGGMLNFDNGNPTLTHVSFSNNSAFEGGGIFNWLAQPTLSHVSFSSNRADRHGGGMRNHLSNPKLTNISFSGSLSNRHGGGMYNGSSNPTLTNVSFSDNRASTHGGGMYNLSSSHSVIHNSIFWNNLDNSGTGTAAATIFNDDSIPQISYSLVQGCNPAGAWSSACGNDAGNNLPDADPLFINTPDPAAAPSTSGNLRLSASSPALDAGNNAVVTATADLVGNVRIVNITVDLGPYERPSSACPSGGVIHVSQLATEVGDGESWVSAFRDLQDAFEVEESCEL